MPQVGRQQRQLRSQVGARFVPAEEPEHGERVPEIVKAWTSATTQMRNVCEIEHLTEGCVEALWMQALTPTRPGKEDVVGVGPADVRADGVTTGVQAIREIPTDGHKPSLPKLAAPHRDHLLDEIDISIVQRQQFSASETRQKLRRARPYRG